MKSFLSKLLLHQADEWSDHDRLLRWGRSGPDWTVGLSFEGSLHTGASGSGKTSAGMCVQTVAMMKAGYGLLVLTTKGTKQSDVDLVLAMAREAGRENSVVIVGPKQSLGFNVLRHEMAAASGVGGDMAGNVAAMFSAAAELTQTHRDGKNGEPIWKLAVESLVRHAVTLVYAATADLRLDDLLSLVKSAPQSLTQLKDQAWCRESNCIRFLDQATKNKPNDRNVRLARDYFLEAFPSYPADTKNSVLFTLGAGCADLFQRDPLHRMFFAGTDYTPKILLDGAILIVDLPVLEYREVGQLANGLMRLCVQRMLDRRGQHSSQRPVGIIWDESQKTLLRSDVAWQETARSARCAVVAATQHLPSLREAVGQDLAASFMGNLRTKLFFQNNEPETCDYVRRLCGKKEVHRTSTNKGADGKTGATETPVVEDALPGQALHNLKTGGKQHGFKVTAFLIVGSKKLRGGEPFQKVLIHQRKLKRWWFTRRAQIVTRRRPAPDFRYLRSNKEDI